jgi:hypothetical protein
MFQADENVAHDMNSITLFGSVRVGWQRQSIYAVRVLWVVTDNFAGIQTVSDQYQYP